MSRPSLAAGLVAGVVLDRHVRDPRRGHPVAIFGEWAATHERYVYADSLIEGTGFLLRTVAPVALVARRVNRRLRHRPLARTAVTALATWTVLGGAGLHR